MNIYRIYTPGKTSEASHKSCFPCDWSACGYTRSLLVDWVPLTRGCFLRAGSRGPRANDVTVNDYPPAACQVHWGKRAPSVSKSSAITSNCLQTELYTGENIHCLKQATGMLLNACQRVLLMVLVTNDFTLHLIYCGRRSTMSCPKFFMSSKSPLSYFRKGG